MERVRTGPVVRVLSWDPVVYLGRISYGTYLWHWPIIVFTLLITNRHISPVSLFAISALLADGAGIAQLHPDRATHPPAPHPRHA